MRTVPEFGVDWYPEQWPEVDWASDVERMAAYGFDCVRIMEFAWSLIEPEPGQFDFTLFDRAIALLAAHGLQAIIGTPTATPPVWLSAADIFRISADGKAHGFGTRRNVCYNAPAYRTAVSRVLRAIADHYGQDRRIIGFQVDNEIGHEGTDRCYCRHCATAWHGWLQGRYASAVAMNATWGSLFWNTAYRSFDQVPVPLRQPATGHNPGLLLDYDRFCSDSAVDFAWEQGRILRSRLSDWQWMTTNLFPPPLSNTIDMEKLTQGMDFAAWDNYPVWGEQDEPFPWQFSAMAQSYVRGLRGNVAFTVMEAMSGIQGHACLGHLPPERQVALWAIQAIARGANRVVFFRWRTAPYGQEQLCHGLIDADNCETERLRMLAAMMVRAKLELGPVIGQTLCSPVCIGYSKDDARVLREQYLSKGLYLKAAPYAQAGYDLELARWFAPFATFGINADVKPVGSIDLKSYKIISLPLYQMADPEVVGRLAEWVERGGCLVLGYRAGARDLNNHSVSQILPGIFQKLAGIRVPRFESLNMTQVALRIGLAPARGQVWADIIELDTARVAATWTDRRKFYRGHPAVTVNTVGRGQVWYIGTSLNPAGIFLLYRRILTGCGLKFHFSGPHLERITRRTVDGRDHTVLLNHSARACAVAGRRIGPWDWQVISDK
jgi:beta-galactosidase